MGMRFVTVAPRWDLIKGPTFPNTPLFKRLGAEGRILTHDWSKYNGKKDVVFQPALISPHELLMGMEWAAWQFYSLGSIVERMARSRTGLWWNIAHNLGYHLALRNFGDVGFNPEVGEHMDHESTNALTDPATGWND